MWSAVDAKGRVFVNKRAALVNRRDALALMAVGAGAAACAPEGASDGGWGPARARAWHPGWALEAGATPRPGSG